MLGEQHMKSRQQEDGEDRLAESYHLCTFDTDLSVFLSGKTVRTAGD